MRPFFNKDLYVFNVNAGQDNEHMIHKYTCSYRPKETITINFYNSAKEALAQAQKVRPELKYELCSYCCADKEKHKRKKEE